MIIFLDIKVNMIKFIAYIPKNKPKKAWKIMSKFLTFLLVTLLDI